jgi:PAS domain S-box-containing protein
MVTGSGDEHTGEEAVKLGAQDYLIKEEVTMHSLPRSIEFAIARFELEQELRAREEQYRHLAERLQESEERLRLALDAADVNTWDWNLNSGKILWSENLEPQLAMPAGSFQGGFEAFMELVYPQDRERVRQAVARSLEHRDEYRIEFRMLRADGNIRWTETRGTVRYDQTGNPVRMVGVDVDITQRKRAEHVLRRAHEELESHVKERTAQLSQTLSALEREVEVRKEAENRMRELSARLQRLQDDERRRIARDLHDTTGQTLTALKLTAAALQARIQTKQNYSPQVFDELNALADQALQEMRTTSYLLHPPLLDESGFCSAAQWYVEGFTKRCGIEVALDLQEPGVRPSMNVETVLFRVLQESLTNIVRHSGSSKAAVTLRFQPQTVVLRIRDFGIGIPSEKLREFVLTGSGMGVGLAGMKARVREIGGHMDIDSHGAGTCVTVCVDLTSELGNFPSATSTAA